MATGRKKNTIALVTVTVQVEVGPWGEGDLIDDVIARSERDAERLVTNAIQGKPQLRLLGSLMTRVVSTVEIDR